MIAVTKLTGTANPGIVPPWLQSGPAPAPAPVPKPAPRPAPAPIAAHRDAGIVVVTTPHRGTAASGARSIGAFGNVGDDAREQQRVEETVAQVQAAYAKFGITDREGNGPVVARFEPRYDNASYASADFESDGISFAKDSITVGVDPRSGESLLVKDVVAHELGHRIVAKMVPGGLSNYVISEDGAISESLADTFAALMVDTDDWEIGDELRNTVRSMDHPERLGHPGTVADLGSVLDPRSGFMHPIANKYGQPVINPQTGKPLLIPDWHVVAGIPNKAASLIGNELGRETTAKIYLKAVRENLRADQEIEGLAAAVLKSAKDLYGAQSREFQATRDAWDAVGVLELLTKQAPAQ